VREREREEEVEGEKLKKGRILNRQRKKNEDNGLLNKQRMTMAARDE
jgi:hypothetical protein